MVRRIQRSRERGSRQPPNTLYCGRPSGWGNPFPIGERYSREEALEAFRRVFWANELPMTPERASVCQLVKSLRRGGNLAALHHHLSEERRSQPFKRLRVDLREIE